MKRVLRCVIVVLAVLGVAATASAGTILNFHPNGLGGTVVKTPDGVLATTSYGLSVAWLVADGPEPMNVPINFGALYFDMGGADPSLTLVGTINGMASGTLLYGTVFKELSYGSSGVTALWEGELSSQLAHALGLNSTVMEFTTNLWFEGGPPVAPGQYFTNYYDIASVPEPGTMLLFGSGLLGLAAVARRRLRR